MQVSSLRAQANEHRLVKEKLQAAVAAALAGDTAADVQLSSAHSSKSTSGYAMPQQSSPDATVLDLEDAISSLQVRHNILYAYACSLSKIPRTTQSLSARSCGYPFTAALLSVI